MEQNLFSILKSRVAGTSLKLVAASGKKGQDLKRKRHTKGFGYLRNCVSYCIYLFSVGEPAWHGPHVEIREQLAGLGDLLPPCGSSGSNSGCQN